MEFNTQSIAISKNPETEGFDLQAGVSWIYPTNYPTREYQFNIIQEALLKNTLVSLPTGLGKTFIAAVVMFNFYRWYPNGKIIFMAPTRPLVKQQIDACYNIMAIPHKVTAELTGTKNSVSRADVWMEKRVFFVTPQVLQNDLETLSQLGGTIRCLVFDEAHKARGNHAYCQVVRKLVEDGHKYFRVLALSATPGSNTNDVSEVVQNLLISHLEFKTEESLDVKPYVFRRTLETVVVELGDKLMEVKEKFLKILDQNIRTLIKYKIVRGDCSSLTKGKLFMLLQEYKRTNGSDKTPVANEIKRSLNKCISLYHAYELLIRHGLRSFVSFVTEHINNPLMRGDFQVREIMEEVKSYLGPIPDIQMLPDGSYPEIPKSIKFGHPKHYKLRDILISHFSSEEHKNSRVIVFFEYRESAMESHILLLQSRPLILPKLFLGQGGGVTQKIQLAVVKAFREGKCNTLLSTCIGEEGLDVGDVDLIVCFDISTKSPIRMVQRMGRTGRKRSGSVLVLVTEGKEQQTLKDCLIHKNNAFSHIFGSVHIRNSLFPNSPRLVPENLTPKCEKMFITVTEQKQQNIMDKFFRRSKSSSELIFSQNYDDIEFKNLIPDSRMIAFEGAAENSIECKNIFNRRIEKIRNVQKTYGVQHSDTTKALIDLLHFADAKRFNVPTITQGSENNPTKALKQGDIRSMFAKDPVLPASLKDFQVTQTTQKDSLDTFTPECTEKISPLSSAFQTEPLFKLLSNYLTSSSANDTKKCSYCDQIDCEKFALNFVNNNLSVMIPSEEVIKKINMEDIDKMIASLDGTNEQIECLKDTVLDLGSDFEEEDVFEEPIDEKQFCFEAPSNYSKLKDTFREIEAITPSPFSQQREELKPISEKELCEFFMLESLDELLKPEEHQNSSQETIIYSPEIDNVHDVAVRSEYPVNATDKNHSDSDIIGSDLDDFCDLAYFGLADTIKSPICKERSFKLDEDRTPSPQDLELLEKNDCNVPLNESIMISSEEEFLLSPTLPQRETFDTSLNKSIKPIKKPSMRNVANISKSCNIDNNLRKFTNSDVPITQIIDSTCEPNNLNQSIKPSLNNLKIPITQMVDMLNETTQDKCTNNNENSIENKSFVCGRAEVSFHKGSSTSRNPLEESAILNTSDILLKTPFKRKERVPSICDKALERKGNILNNSIFRKPTNITRKKISKTGWISKEQASSSEDDFEPVETSFVAVRKKKSTKRPNTFLDMEARLSDDENVFVSDDEEEDFPDHYDKSFVNDETQQINSETHAMYLQSIKSPAKPKFRRPLPPMNPLEIYSQLPQNDYNSYLVDSFCVDKPDELLTQVQELSELDILERQLEEKRKRKKKSKLNCAPTKRRRIKCISSDSE
ncbi:Fanconi anemia group M protein [Anthonomus grandis grandis]|uniref:Fanconi anemia group M protein n=1 Tax=Anthonomus grandis grandis TaxID=2921223 RepID=UPI002165BEEB|nr:Fanconi anemia group M protein [Anthonomus grandis grandis]